MSEDRKREGVERAAAKLREQSAKSGQQMSHESAKARVIDALRNKGNLNR